MDCRGQEVNPDISGIGVRLSFYLQNFFLVLLVDRSWQDAAGALWTFIFTNIALTASAIVQASRHQLSLFQALTVGNLVWMANVGIYLSLAPYSRHRAFASQAQKGVAKSPWRSISVVQYTATLQMFFTMALTIYVWTNARNFGNQDECAPFVNYVAFFGVDFPALKSGRKLGLTVTILLVVLYSITTSHEFMTCRSYVLEEKQKLQQDFKARYSISHTWPPASLEARAASITVPEPAAHICISMPLPSLDATLSPHLYPHREQFHHPTPIATHRVDPMFISLTFVHIIMTIYFVVSTELLLRHNPAADNSNGEWEFGQIFALIAVVPSLLSVLEAFHDHGIRMHPLAQ